jgi:predicted metal-dependent enzyme (double-stranded beta helix superfamily)
MKKIKILFQLLVNDPAMREHAKKFAVHRRTQNLLLYEDPECDFAVNAVVRTPGRDGRIDDQAHAWTAYGVLNGRERLERYRCLDDGSKPDYALIQLDSGSDGHPGRV